MARITYGSLFLNFTPDTTDIPTQTNITNLITNYYAQSYEIVYGVGNYDTTDTDTTDPKTIIRATEFEASLVAELSWKVQQWHDSGISSDGQLIQMPSFDISEKLENKLKRMIGKTNERIASIRLYGSDYDDMGVL